MTGAIERVRARMAARPQRWLVTGAAGFIGSHLVRALLELDQEVVGLDDFSTGSRRNLDDVRREVGPSRWSRMSMIEGDVRDAATCQSAIRGVERVLHQAALGSVPRSIERPADTHAINVDGFAQVALAAVEAKVEGFVFASSSSVYGDHPGLPKVEAMLGRPLSPYAASKRMNEIHAEALAVSFGLPAIGLRYFNVVGPRQDPAGPYAAVVPRWLASLDAGERPTIYGDGMTSRDFCPIDNVVQANLLAAFAPPDARGHAFNVALGARTTLRELFDLLRDGMAERGAPCAGIEPIFAEFRKGDIRHSLADISRARDLLGYEPECSLREGLGQLMSSMRARPAENET